MGICAPSVLQIFAFLIYHLYNLTFIGEALDGLFLELCKDYVKASPLYSLFSSAVWTLFQILSGVGLGPHPLCWR